MLSKFVEKGIKILTIIVLLFYVLTWVNFALQVLKKSDNITRQAKNKSCKPDSIGKRVRFCGLL